MPNLTDATKHKLLIGASILGALFCVGRLDLANGVDLSAIAQKYPELLGLLASMFGAAKGTQLLQHDDPPAPASPVSTSDSDREGFNKRLHWLTQFARKHHQPEMIKSLGAVYQQFISMDAQVAPEPKKNDVQA
jgi:hypothetical protein